MGIELQLGLVWFYIATGLSLTKIPNEPTNLYIFRLGKTVKFIVHGLWTSTNHDEQHLGGLCPSLLVIFKFCF